MPSLMTSRRARLRLERLEDRSVPAVVNWTLAGNGDFANLNNWTVAGTGVHRVPLATDDAVIPSPFSVTSSANVTVNSLVATNFQVLSGTFAILQLFTQTAGTTTVAAGATLQANVQINGGILAGGGAVVGNVAGGGSVSPGVGIGFLSLTGNVTLGGALVADVSYPTAPAVHMTNRAGQDADTVLGNGQQFITDFKGANDLTMTLIGVVGNLNNDHYPVSNATTSNNPGYLSGFIGSAADGTGDNTPGGLRTLRTFHDAVNTTLQFDFARPLTSSDRFVLADIDAREQYRVRAFLRSGTTYQEVSLLGWNHQLFTGEMGIIPVNQDNRWASWDPATGMFVADNNGDISEPLNVLTPDQSIDRIIIDKTFGGNASTGLQFIYGATAGTHFDQLAVIGKVTLSEALNLAVGSAVAVGTRFRLIDNDGTDAVVGTFAGLAEGATLTIGGQTFSISYVGGSNNNDVVLTRIATPPSILNTQINNGSAQRSRVTSLTVTFDAPVTFASTAAAAFTLTRIGGGTLDFTATVSNATGATVVTLSGFTGTATSFGSLADGRYTLTAIAGQIAAEGFQLDGNGNGIDGDNFVLTDSGQAGGLFRLYGDANGDRVVNGADIGAFVAAFGAPSLAFDSNFDGVVNGADVGALVANFGRSVP